MKAKRLLSMGLAAAVCVGTLGLAGCGSKGSDSAENTFSWWLYTDDGAGTYYNSFEDNPSVQWLNQQYWDTENHTLGTADNGSELHFTFQTPIEGSEQDNFNTMIGTGEYTDLLDMSLIADPMGFYDDGVIMEITDYVEKYMPDYVAYLDANPSLKSQVSRTDEDGTTHYYYVANILDGPELPWGGFVYRRDWVVEYAEPTDYVWDWDSDYVKENGHPEVTPLEKAKEQNNLNGWKQNEVTEFTANQGEDPNNTYTDNVIFPSGTSDPLTISDWEWMFEAFTKAIDEKGFSNDSDAYAVSMYYPGYITTGDLVSSFGGGGGYWSVDEDNQVYFSGASDNFRTYLDCLHNWYEQGWLDEVFETRTGDAFYMVNMNGTNMGKVGLWYGLTGTIGTTIRATCEDPTDQQNAFVMACASPINDVYGTADQMYKDPDTFYQGSRVAGGVALTDKCESRSEEELAALFTYFNWMFTEVGSDFHTFGLNADQLASADLDDNLYEEYGMDAAYTKTTDESGNVVYTSLIDTSLDGNAFTAARMAGGLTKTGVGENIGYSIDRGYSNITEQGTNEWARYESIGAVSTYTDDIMDGEDRDAWDKAYNDIYQWWGTVLPTMIKDGVTDESWNSMVDKLRNDFNIDQVTEIAQKYIDEIQPR